MPSTLVEESVPDVSQNEHARVRSNCTYKQPVSSPTLVVFIIQALFLLDLSIFVF